MSRGDLLRESRVFALVSSIILFLQASAASSLILNWVSRALEAVYPDRLYSYVDGLNSRHESCLARHIFSPLLIFPLLYLVFISLSSYRVSDLAFITIVLGLLAFAIGVATARHDKGEMPMGRSARELGTLLFTIGLVFLAIDLSIAGELPIFQPEARRKLVVVYTMLAELLPPGAMLLIAHLGWERRTGAIELRKARVHAFMVLIASLLLISTLGFRTQVLVTLLGGVIAMYLTGLLGFIEVAGALMAAGGVAVLTGYLRARIQHSPVSVFTVLTSRIGLTMSVYDFLVRRFMPFGANKGYTFLASFSSLIPGLPGPKLGPRTIVARLFGVTGISMTSTLLGTVVLDFGIPGVLVFMFLLGHVLGTGYHCARTQQPLAVGLYSLLLSYSLVGIETGIVDFNVLMMFLLSYLAFRSRED